MNGTVDINTTDDGEQGSLDPRTAATLLAQTGRDAKRELDVNPLRISLAGAVIFFVIYGGLYMGARNEHPYTGPKGAWLIVWPLGVLAALVVNGARYDRMKRTLNGHTLLRVRATSAAVVIGLIGIYTLDGALKNAGVGDNIVYGIFDASAPLIVMGSIGMANGAWREDWPTLGVSGALVLVATGAAFAGPDGVWGVIAIGGSLACLGQAAARAYLQRR